MTFDCPRCQRSTDATYYGPCPVCREELVAAAVTEGRDVEIDAYEPKMNVVPNQVATKD
jgi:Zn finger protein HypA/HybF involved in hydrogenase expression